MNNKYDNIYPLNKNYYFINYTGKYIVFLFKYYTFYEQFQLMLDF